MPLIKTSTLKILVEQAKNSNFSILTVIQKDPSGYGRIIRNSNQLIQSIIEHKDASESELKIDEINTGIMAIKRKSVKKIPKPN